VSEEILINVTPRETRVAVVENGMLQEVHVERALRRGYVGNIYKGRVSRVMPGMQAAFVEVGLERAAFLHASDIVRTIGPSNNGVARVARDDPPSSLAPAGEGKSWGSPALLSETAEIGPSPPPPISELVHEGQKSSFRSSRIRSARRARG
jgi:ribonuclease G